MNTPSQRRKPARELHQAPGVWRTQALNPTPPSRPGPARPEPEGTANATFTRAPRQGGELGRRSISAYAPRAGPPPNTPRLTYTYTKRGRGAPGIRYAGVIEGVARRPAVPRVARVRLRRAVQCTVNGHVPAPRDLTKGHPVELRPRLVRISPARLRRLLAAAESQSQLHAKLHGAGWELAGQRDWHTEATSTINNIAWNAKFSTIYYLNSCNGSERRFWRHCLLKHARF